MVLAPGDTMRYALGIAENSGCAPVQTSHVTWSAGPPDVATMDSAGLLRAVGAGTFTVRADGEGVSLRAPGGYVLPRGWRPRIFPVSAVIHVGDTIGFRVRAIDSAGHDLPEVPFGVEVPEHATQLCDSAYVRPCRAEVPPDSVGTAAVLVGTRIGRTQVIGRIADRTVTGSIRIIARTDTAVRR